MEWHLKISLLVFVLIKVANLTILESPHQFSAVLGFYNSCDNKLIIEVVHQSVISSLCFVCKSSITGTESHLRDHMATVESSFMNPINSFIHERGCTATGLLFIVRLLECVPVRLPGPRKD